MECLIFLIALLPAVVSQSDVTIGASFLAPPHESQLFAWLQNYGGGNDYCGGIFYSRDVNGLCQTSSCTSGNCAPETPLCNAGYSGGSYSNGLYSRNTLVETDVFGDLVMLYGYENIVSLSVQNGYGYTYKAPPKFAITSGPLCATSSPSTPRYVLSFQTNALCSSVSAKTLVKLQFWDAAYALPSTDTYSAGTIVANFPYTMLQEVRRMLASTGKNSFYLTFTVKQRGDGSLYVLLSLSQPFTDQAGIYTAPNPFLSIPTCNRTSNSKPSFLISGPEQLPALVWNISNVIFSSITCSCNFPCAS